MTRYRMPHPFAPPRPGGTPLAELIDRHAHLVAVGLPNCRAAQALHKEITRRKIEQRNAELETQNSKPKTAFLANDDDHYNPNELRNKETGRWMTFGDLLPDDLKRLLAYLDEHYLAPAGKALDRAGKVTMAKLGDLGDQLTGDDKIAEIEDNRDAYEAACRIVDQDPAIQKLLAETDQELKSAKTEAQWQEANRKRQEAIHARNLELIKVYQSLKVSPTNMEALARGDKQLPVESNLNLLPAPLRVFAQASQALVESSPRLAVAGALEAIGIPPEFAAAAAFGITAQGLDPKQAIIAAAVPEVGKYAEDITQAIAARIGISNEFAQELFKKMGGAAGMTALIGADQLKEIWKQAPEKQKTALIQIAAILGTLFIIGMAGHGVPEKPTPEPQPESTSSQQKSGPGDSPQAPEPPIALQPYGGSGGGHHPAASSAMRGDPNYNRNRSLAISNSELARLGVKHPVITGNQQILYRAFAKTGQKLEWPDVERIETQALMLSGVKSEAIAHDAVKQAISQEIAAGVKPTRIPWGN